MPTGIVLSPDSEWEEHSGAELREHNPAPRIRLGGQPVERRSEDPFASYRFRADLGQNPHCGITEHAEWVSDRVLPALSPQRVVEPDADGLACLEAIRDLVEHAADHRLDQWHRPVPVAFLASSRINRAAGDG